MTHWQRDVPGSFSHPEQPPTVWERAGRRLPLTLLLLALGIAAWCLIAAVIVYGPTGRF